MPKVSSARRTSSDALGTAYAVPFGVPLPVRDLRFIIIRLRVVSEVCASLDAGPWTLFLALLAHIGANLSACVSQSTLANETAYCERSIRSFVDVLERVGLIVVLRERLSNGHERHTYALGELGVRELEKLARSARPKALARPVPPPATDSAGPPETVAGKFSGSLSVERSSLSCSSDLTSAGASARARNDGPTTQRHEEEKRIFVQSSEESRATSPQVEGPPSLATAEDMAIAEEVLRAFAKRRRPNAPPPRWFDRERVELVALRLSQREGSPAEKLAGELAVLDAAFAASKDGAPTFAFVWADQDHHAEHLRRGLAMRAQEERRRAAQDARKRAEAEGGQDTPPAGSSRVKGAAKAGEGPLSREELDRMIANALDAIEGRPSPPRNPESVEEEPYVATAPIDRPRRDQIANPRDELAEHRAEAETELRELAKVRPELRAQLERVGVNFDE